MRYTISKPQNDEQDIVNLYTSFTKVKLRSHRANGRVTDKKLFYPFVSVRIRSLSVSHPVTPFLVRWCPFRPFESFEHVQNFPPDKTD